MAGPLQGKAALVTGGSRGIGAAIARRLAKEGAAVALTYAGSADKAAALASEIEAAGGRALSIRVEASDPSAVAAAVEAAADGLGRLDILVNNAGIAHFEPLDAYPLAEFDRTYAVNVRAVFVAAQAAARRMSDGGRIVTIGSVNGTRMPFPGGFAYAMSKAAVEGLTRGLARDLGPRGITVNVVAPGPVDTDLNPDQGDFAEALKAELALPRYGRTEEVAAMTAYLCGPEAAYVTGATLTIDGGFNA